MTHVLEIILNINVGNSDDGRTHSSFGQGILIDINGFTTLYNFFDWALNCAEKLDDGKMEGYDDVGLYLYNGWEDCVKEEQTMPVRRQDFWER